MKRRLLFVDLLRVLSMILVFFHHLRAQLLALNSSYVLFWPSSVFGISLGDISVSMFILLSGFSLYYTYKPRISYSSFVKSKFIRLMIPYWIYFVMMFILMVWRHWIVLPIDKTMALFSFTGLDNLYISFNLIPNYAISDWYLGFIIILYLISPLVFATYNKFKGYSLLIFGLLSFCSYLVFPNLPLRVPTTRLLEFSAGIYLCDLLYGSVEFKNKKVIKLLLFSLMVFLLSFSFNFFGLSLFLKAISLSVLIFFSFYFINLIVEKKKNLYIRLSLFFSKIALITYPFFLSHHQIIYRYRYVCTNNSARCVEKIGYLIIILLLTIIFVSMIINFINNYILKLKIKNV